MSVFTPDGEGRVESFYALVYSIIRVSIFFHVPFIFTFFLGEIFFVSTKYVKKLKFIIAA